MMNFINLLLNFISYAFDFFTMELFTLSFFPYQHKKQTYILRFLFLSLYILSSVSAYATILCYIANFLYLYIVSSCRFKETFYFFLKYTIIIECSYFFASLICAAINLDVPASLSYNNIYFSYQSVTCTMLVYILINLNINIQRLRKLHIYTIYPFTFSLLSLLVIFLLLFFNQSFAKYTELSPYLPSLYVSVILILILSLSSYRKIIISLESQTTQKLLLEKYEMEISYFENVQESLNTLSRIRHDFKNHLIVLDTYARQNRISELREYMTKINSELTNSKLTQTPSNLISSILNTKKTLCEKKGISFQITCSFETIYLSDFSVITILGNILDNAITAASQTENPIIELSLTQLENFLEIYCKNNYNGTIKEKNGYFISTKNNPGSLHGLGISNVKDCVHALNGSVEFNYDTYFFSVDILVPNYYHAKMS